MTISPLLQTTTLDPNRKPKQPRQKQDRNDDNKARYQPMNLRLYDGSPYLPW
jgi:hypothetical protein